MEWGAEISQISEFPMEKVWLFNVTPLFNVATLATGHEHTTYYAQQVYYCMFEGVVVSYNSSKTAVLMENNGQIIINRGILLT